jgi:hypothetical protein
MKDVAKLKCKNATISINGQATYSGSYTTDFNTNILFLYYFRSSPCWCLCR